MGAKLNRVLIVDVEATCWKTPEEQGTKPNEIIEIGTCFLELKTGNINTPHSYIVKPQHSEVSKFCTELTGWTQADIDKGQDISKVISYIEQDLQLSKHHLWFSCGEYDRIKLSSYGIPFDGSASLCGLYGISEKQNIFARMRAHINIKTLFALKYKLSREMGMARMLSHIGETLEGKHHNGMADAMNIAKIVRNVFQTP